MRVPRPRAAIDRRAELWIPRRSASLVRVHGAAAMAGGKVNALLNDNRSVPRDVYDLSELVRHGADPTELWVRHIPPEVLQRKRPAIMAKIEGIDLQWPSVCGCASHRATVGYSVYGWLPRRVGASAGADPRAA
jgi:hypothetical protein